MSDRKDAMMNYYCVALTRDNVDVLTNRPYWKTPPSNLVNTEEKKNKQSFLQAFIDMLFIYFILHITILEKNNLHYRIWKR
jgi:hypothetical protein